MATWEAEEFFETNEALGTKAITETKTLFDKGAVNDGENIGPLEELHVEGFESEQIWQQIQMQNESVIKSMRRALSSFSKGRLNLYQEKEETDNEEDADTASSSSEQQDEEDDLSEEDMMDDDDDDDVLSDQEEERTPSATVRKQPRDEVEDGFFDWDEMERAAEEEEKADDTDEAEDEEDEDGEELPETAGHDEFFGAEVPASDSAAGNFKNKLDEEEQSPSDVEESAERGVLSAHQQRMQKLQSQISELEATAISEKSWELRGEVNSAARPENSLLAATLEYDRTTKVAPTITPEVTSVLEDVIKERIREGNFDDVERRLAPTERKQRELAEVSQEKSKESLGELYEKEYMKSSLGFEETDELKLEQDEIQSMFDRVCWKLNALSNFHFTPKPVVHEIQIKQSAPAIAMEEVVPMAVSDANLKAPEEVYDKKHGRDGVVQANEEMSKEARNARRLAKKSSRRKERKQKAADEKLVSKINPGLGNKYEKQKMLESLSANNVKTGRNIEGSTSQFAKSSQFFKNLQEETQAKLHGLSSASVPEKKEKKFNAAALKL